MPAVPLLNIRARRGLSRKCPYDDTCGEVALQAQGATRQSCAST